MPPATPAVFDTSIVFVAVSVLVLAIVSVALEAGAVMVTLLSVPASARLPLASSVVVAEGVCDPCEPAPVIRAVLVKEAAEVTQVAHAIAPAADKVTGEVAVDGIVPPVVGPVSVTEPAFAPG